MMTDFPVQQLNTIEKDANSINRNTEDTIFFNFSYAALKLLGKNLYSNAVNAISELVANSVDANASEIYVYIDMCDKEHSIIEILDNGCGMNYNDLATKYVWIGRNKRLEDTFTKQKKESIMGRKGIGKLAALYLSNQYYILTKKVNPIEVGQWQVDLSSYADYELPRLDRVQVKIDLINQDIWNQFEHGTAIRLENVDLRRNGEKRIEALRRVFADYYLLDGIHAKVYIAVKSKTDEKIVFNKVEKKIAYKNFFALFDNSGMNLADKMRDSIPFIWASNYPHIANTPRRTEIIDVTTCRTSGAKLFDREDGSQIKKKYNLSGWIAIHSSIDTKNAQLNDENFIRNDIYQPNRLRLYVRNKLAIDDYFSISPNTQAMSNYIEGDISFDILDDDDLPDIATSNRQDFRADERVELLKEIVNPIINMLIASRVKVGSTISKENAEYALLLDKQARERQKASEEARRKAEIEAINEKEARKIAEMEKDYAQRSVAREKQRSQYIINISRVEDKNILNSIHSIYNMSSRVKQNLDELNGIISPSTEARIKLEKATTSNQRILSISKLISKAGYLVDDNDASKTVNVGQFVIEYVEKALANIYNSSHFSITYTGDTQSEFYLKIKPLSFVMMIDNLVGNAIKASAKTVNIVINDSNSDVFEILFIDDGHGIDKSIENVDDLFEFGVTTTNGSGLGLYYSKKTMKSLNGTISIADNHPQGTIVTLSWIKRRI